VVSADGGSPEQVIPGEDPDWDATWSPDGNSLAFSGSSFEPNSVVHLIDLRTHPVSTLPGSEGLFSPPWSRDGRSLVAMSHNLQNSQKLLMYTFTTQKWEQLVLAKSIGYPDVYFEGSATSGTPFYRVRVSDHKLERIGVVSLARGMVAGQFGDWTGLTPDDSPLVLHNRSIQKIYALDLQLP
jgi:hypothetical protein